jgi:hypothetical protein
MSNGNTPEHGEMATVEISSQIQASGALVEVGPKDRGTVDLGGRQVSGTLIPSVRRLTLGLPETDIEQETNDEDPSPC